MAVARTGCVCVDGRLLAPHEATVSALDTGFLLGDGLFESLRATGGAPYLLDRHLARLYAAARELEFADVPTPDALAERVRETLDRAALDDAYLRITITRGEVETALSAPSAAPTVVIAALPAPPRPAAGAGIAAALVGPPPQRGPKAKSTSRQPAVLARRRAERAGAQEGIYVSARGRVLEGTAANVFAVSDGRLLTPPAEDCLPGITRGRLIELARDAGLDVREAPVTVAELLGAEQAIATNAVQGLRAIEAIDGRRVGAGCEGVVFAKLLALYEADRAAAAASPSAGATAAGAPRAAR